MGEMRGVEDMWGRGMREGRKYGKVKKGGGGFECERKVRV